MYAKCIYEWTHKCEGGLRSERKEKQDDAANDAKYIVYIDDWKILGYNIKNAN